MTSDMAPIVSTAGATRFQGNQQTVVHIST